ncbi:MAG: hypothetical protein V4556_03465 [Bacteroidota bacterium]
MKKAIVLSIIVIAVFGCSKKVTPTTTSTTTPTETPAPMVVAETNIASGRITYEAKCGRCHALPIPQNFTATRWVGLVDWMAPKAKLTDAEKANVLAYVQANAKS